MPRFETAITINCPAFVGGCGKDYLNPLMQYKPLTGKHIQDRYPMATKEERECAITGFCPECQKVIFAEPKEE